MATAYDVPADKLIEGLAEELKNLISMPEWALFVKTGPDREHPPLQKDWWYIRAASIMRRLYIDGPKGVSRLRRWYGGRKNYGHAPEHHVDASGKIIRTILQQLEEVGLVMKVEGGRVLTPKGRSMVDKVANRVMGYGGSDEGAGRKKKGRAAAKAVAKTGSNS